jgi:hypothetical protein
MPSTLVYLSIRQNALAVASLLEFNVTMKSDEVNQRELLYFRSLALLIRINQIGVKSKILLLVRALRVRVRVV